MRQELFSDIDPPIKQALQRRKNRISDKNDPNHLGEYSKSAWIKVWPLAIIELSKQDFPKLSEDTNPTQTTAGVERYILGMQPPLEGGGVRDPLSSYNDRIDKDGNTYGYNRPKPGLTGLSVQYEGYSGKGLVKMQLKGVINTLEELDIYKPILFAPGKYWCLEWGFIPHKDDGITHNLITTKTITDLYAVRNMPAIWDKVEEHRKITNGTAEIQIAVVNNYEYTLNAAGGFEFTVEFTGNSTLFRNNSPAAVGSGFEIKLPDDPEFYDNMHQIVYNEGEENEKIVFVKMAPGDELAQQVPGGLNTALGIDRQRNEWGITIEEKFRAATPNDFFKDLKDYIIKCYKSAGKLGQLDPVTGKPFVEVGDLVQYPNKKVVNNTELDVKKHGIYYEAEKTPILMGGQKFNYNDFNNEIGPYVTWGWFEDNILNVVYGKNKSTSHPLKWESVDQSGIPLPLNSHKYLYTTTPNRLIIPGRMPELLENELEYDPSSNPFYISRGHFEETTVEDTGGKGIASSYKGEHTVITELGPRDVSSVFGAYHPIVYDYIAISESALGFDEDINNTLANESDAVGAGLVNLAGLDANELADMAGYVTDQDLYDEREVLIRTKSGERGSIRRLVLHYRLIQDSFIGAATPIEGLRTLLNKIENMGYKGFWEFDIFEVDNKIGVYEKNSLTALSEQVLNKIRVQIEQNRIDSRRQSDETPPEGEVFVFPTWNKDGGFVINQNLTVKIASAINLAMVYGNSLAGEKALQNANFGGDGDQGPIFGAISSGGTAVQKVEVDPGFQGSLIQIVKQIKLDGTTNTNTINREYKLKKAPTRERPEEEKLMYRYVGEQNVPLDGELNIFKRGVSIDAHGIMYENVKQVMNHRLKMTWLKVGDTYDKLTARDTRSLDMAELSIKIQGLSGLNWGNDFHTDYIEERFKSECVFFVSKINHEISENNWTTEIIGKMRGIFVAKYIKDKVSLTEEEDRFINIQLTAADTKLIEKMRKTHRSILINSGRMYRESKLTSEKDTKYQRVDEEGIF